jgi:hypothetical protein
MQQAQAGDASAPPAGTTPPGYKFLRYDEDYRYLKDSSARADFWNPVKYMPLTGADNYISLGGEIRERFEDYSAANFGVPGRVADSYLLHRILLHADLHFGERVRTFTQVGTYRAFGKNAAAPPYSDQVDLQQGFVDVRFGEVPDSGAGPSLRIGRQEIAFGAQRLVSVRDAPNVRRAFDGVRVSGSAKQTHYDVFVTRPVLLEEGDFDDKSNTTQKFWGIYLTRQSSPIPRSAIDVYYLGFENDHALYSIGTGGEKRHTIGTRVFGHGGRWDWDWEAIGQFGSFAQKDIRAWGLAFDSGYTYPGSSWKPRAGFKLTAGSGNDDPNGRTLRNYGPLFPKIAYFNQASLIGASNVIDLQPSLAFKPTPTVKVTAACDFIFRETTRDAVFTSLGTPIPRTAGHPGRRSGSEPWIDVTWQADRHLFIDAGVVHVDVSKVLSEAGGHDTNFVYLSATYSF